MKRRSPRPHRVNTKDPRYSGSGYNRGGLAYESKYQKYSEMVRIDTVEEAGISSERLWGEFESSKQTVKKDRLLEETLRAGQEALVRSKDSKIPVAERVQYRKIAQIYSILWNKMRRNWG